MKCLVQSGWLFFALLNFSTSTFAVEEKSVRDRVADFLQEKVIGHPQFVSARGDIVLDGQKYLIAFEATVTWSGVTKTQEGLVFEEKREIKQTNTKVDANDAPVGEPIKNDRSITLRYALGERLVTRSLVGMTTETENTAGDSTGIGSVTMIEISADDKELYVYQSSAGFFESSLDGKNIFPVASASSATISVNKDGKLQTDETLKFYKVDVNKDFAREEINRFNLSAVELKR